MTRYLGNKTKLCDWLYSQIAEISPGNPPTKKFYDLFSGTGAVSERFKGCYNIVSCDNLVSSYMTTNLKLLNRIPEFTELGGVDSVLSTLNALDGYDGEIYKLYSESGPGQRLYFSSDNGRKIDAIRTLLFKWLTDHTINEAENTYLWGCFIYAIHAVANTTGVFGAHLKKLSNKKILNLKRYDLVKTTNVHIARHMDNIELLAEIEPDDIVYLDPPYNSRQYGSNYHLLESICIDAPIIIKQVRGSESKSGLPVSLPVSDMCSKRKVVASLKQYISCPAKKIYLSYNSEGLLTEDAIMEIMSPYGKVVLIKKEYKRYCSNKNNHIIYEYLFCLSKD